MLPAFAVLLLAGAVHGENPPSGDLVVYGATPAGVMAAVAAARQGDQVALVEPSAHVGGVVSGGLTVSDVGKVETVGGLAREFFDRVLKHYTDTYGEESPQVRDCRSGTHFEPHVAEAVFEALLAEQPAIHVWRRHRLNSVTTDGATITGLVADDLATDERRTFAGKVFVDASYTGDLMALAGAAYRVGRESREEYGESLAGMNSGGPELHGRGDHRIQAFNYRVCLTDRADNRLPIPKPEPYDPELFPGMRKAITEGKVARFDELFRGLERWRVPNDKLDANLADNPGANYAYPEGDWAVRARIETDQRTYSLSLLYFLQNDPRLPEPFRRSALEWGLPKDEFTDNGGFPHQVYVREARRLIGRYVLREQDVTEERHKPDGVCLGSYGIDCHSVQRLMGPKGWTLEGGTASPTTPYEIPYRCLTPHAPTNLLVPVCVSATHVAYCTVRMEPVYMMLGHAAGLAAHLALQGNGSVQEVDVEQLRRLLREQGQLLDAPFEPRVAFTWAPQDPVPGQAVAFAVQELEVRTPLVKFWWDFDGDGVVDSQEPAPTHPFANPRRYTVTLLTEDQAGGKSGYRVEQVSVGGSSDGDVTVDDADEGATRTAGWQKSTALGSFCGRTYYHDENSGKGQLAARFRPNLPRAGRYLVCVAYTPNPNRASNVPITICHAGEESTISLDQRTGPTVFPFFPVGEYACDAGTDNYVLISNTETDGYVVVDAVRWVWVGAK